ncbi:MULTISPECIES: cytidine deaminase [Chromobacteriaceae]|uniref:Cytidine deaminase n=2 Tax=Chromobacteriaceae TaxID=1499392 RepID=A0ABV0FL41_9NEIS|nr:MULTISPECIES: cytidine deaminase [Chromobacteriaceae]AVG17520.1 cytidine deaminase [Chromobacterium vaccinii]ERE05159.1 cytidine deaminase [Pseudogulbenkiania ferrooxidans EGD-HP2]MCD4501425.1 cytidine deaminase [Chromobacterium vaccinii]
MTSKQYAPSNEQWAELEMAAQLASRQAYAPYSRFSVGAAILDGNGKIHIGCNVENASFGLSNCAERTAIFAARANHGMQDVVAVCIYTPTDKPTSPCGACRQVLNEFGPAMHVRSICDGEDIIDTTLDALLPSAFGPKNLQDAGQR